MCKSAYRIVWGYFCHSKGVLYSWSVDFFPFHTPWVPQPRQPLHSRLSQQNWQGHAVRVQTRCGHWEWLPHIPWRFQGQLSQHLTSKEPKTRSALSATDSVSVVSVQLLGLCTSLGFSNDSGHCRLCPITLETDDICATSNLGFQCLPQACIVPLNVSIHGYSHMVEGRKKGILKRLCCVSYIGDRLVFSMHQ